MPETPLPQLSIIIPTHQRSARLRNLLSDIAATPHVPYSLEIVVVSDGPDEGPLAHLRVLPATMPAIGLTQPHGGPASARNLALDKARADWVLFLNDDSRLTASCLPGHLARIAAEPMAHRANLGRFEFTLSVIDSAWRRLLAETSMLFFYQRMRHDRDYGYRHFWTCNLAVRRELVREVGGFRTDFKDSIHEDIELGWRLQRQFGLEVRYCSEIEAAHDHPLSPRDYFHREFRSGRAAAAARKINPAFHDEVWPWVADADRQFDGLNDLLRPQFEELLRMLECLRQRPPDDATRRELAATYLAHLPMKRAAFLLGYAEREFEELWPEPESQN